MLSFREAALVTSDASFYSLIFLNPTVDFMSFWEVLWIVGITDFILKFLFMGFKCFILLVPSFMMSFKSKVRKQSIFLLPYEDPFAVELANY